MRWLRKFLYSDDPTVKVAAALSEPEAEFARDVLAAEDIRVVAKNMNFLSAAYIGGFGNDYALWVRRSDAAQARELLLDVVGEERLVG